MRAIGSLAVLLALAASCRCSSVVQIARPPVVEFDGGEDLSARACDVLKAARCPVGLDPDCAAALRNDQAQGVGAMAGSVTNEQCILDAGAAPAALRRCGVTCD